jgi:glycosyltransferase involved in cell wall biosynthesis
VVDTGTYRAKLVRELNCGIVLDSDIPEYVSRAIVSLAKNVHRHKEICAMAKKSSTVCNFNWEAMSAKLVSTYDKLR